MFIGHKDTSDRWWQEDTDAHCTYVYLRADYRDQDMKVARTQELGAGVMIDWDADGNAIGIEFI